MGFLIGGPEETKVIESTPGAWTRPHAGPFAWEWIEAEKGEFNFDVTDWWLENTQIRGISILGTIWPYAGWDQESCHRTECEVSERDQFYPEIKLKQAKGIPKSRCAPCNMDDYKNFITMLVERYDGDGIGDMPNLQIPIKYWEILNEPSMQEEDLTFYKGTKEEYVQILKASHEAIKATCPDCEVVQAGAAGIDAKVLGYWSGIFSMGGADYFDIANIHFINFGDVGTLNVKKFKELLDRHGIDKPIWVTEAEYNSEGEILPSVKGAITAGASKIFFTRFYVGAKAPSKEAGQYTKVYDSVPEICEKG